MEEVFRCHHTLLALTLQHKQQGRELLYWQTRVIDHY